jgi:hypothetical protein
MKKGWYEVRIYRILHQHLSISVTCPINRTRSFLERVERAPLPA